MPCAMPATESNLRVVPATRKKSASAKCGTRTVGANVISTSTLSRGRSGTRPVGKNVMYRSSSGPMPPCETSTSSNSATRRPLLTSVTRRDTSSPACTVPKLMVLIVGFASSTCASAPSPTSCTFTVDVPLIVKGTLTAYDTRSRGLKTNSTSSGSPPAASNVGLKPASSSSGVFWYSQSMATSSSISLFVICSVRVDDCGAEPAAPTKQAPKSCLVKEKATAYGTARAVRDNVKRRDSAIVHAKR